MLRERVVRLVREYWGLTVSVAGLVGLSAAVWGKTIGFSFVWDDLAFVVHNQSIRSWQALPSYFLDSSTMAAPGWGHAHIFRPIRNISYLYDYLLFGLTPSYWHAHNVLLHTLNGVLVFLVLKRRFAGHLLAPYLAACVFLVHPVQTEVVAWVKCRDDLLSVFFALLCAEHYLIRRASWSRADGLFSFLLALLACFSKIQVVVLPAILFLLLPDFRTWRRLIPSGLAVVVALLWRHLFLGQSHQIDYLAGGSVGTMATMVSVLGTYLRLVFWPARLLSDYSGYPVRTGFLDPVVLVGLCAIALGVLALWWLRRRAPAAACGICIFLIALLPVSNVVPTMQFLAERFLYLPMFGVAILVAAIFARVPRSVGRGAVTLSLAMLIGLAVRSSARAEIWRSSLALHTATVADTPEHVLRPRNNMMVELSNLERHQEAGDFAEALWERWGADDEVNLRWRARYARTAGRGRIDRGDRVGGVALLDAAASVDPTFAAPHVDLGDLARKDGDLQVALAHYQRATRLAPDNAGAWVMVGVAQRDMGHIEAAVESLVRATECGPRTPQAHRILTHLLFQLGHMDVARVVLGEALRTWPQDDALRTSLSAVEAAIAAQTAPAQ